MRDYIAPKGGGDEAASQTRTSNTASSGKPTNSFDGFCQQRGGQGCEFIRPNECGAGTDDSQDFDDCMWPALYELEILLSAFPKPTSDEGNNVSSAPNADAVRQRRITPISSLPHSFHSFRARRLLRLSSMNRMNTFDAEFSNRSDLQDCTTANLVQQTAKLCPADRGDPAKICGDP